MQWFEFIFKRNNCIIHLNKQTDYCTLATLLQHMTIIDWFLYYSNVVLTQGIYVEPILDSEWTLGMKRVKPLMCLTYQCGYWLFHTFISHQLFFVYLCIRARATQNKVVRTAIAAASVGYHFILYFKPFYVTHKHLLQWGCLSNDVALFFGE